MSGWFPAPESYVGQLYEPTGHLNVWAATKKLARLGYVGCTDWGKRAGTTRVLGMRAAWISCPQASSLDGGHVVLQWWIRDWTYGVSLHSNTPVNRRLARAIAARLVRVRG
jgi:hypothetical protein